MYLHDRKMFLEAVSRQNVPIKNGDVFIVDRRKGLQDPGRCRGPLPISLEVAIEDAKKQNEVCSILPNWPFEAISFEDPVPDVGEYVLWGGGRGIGRIGKVTEVVPQKGKFAPPKIRVIWIHGENGPLSAEPNDKGSLLSRNYHRLSKDFLRKIARS